MPADVQDALRIAVRAHAGQTDKAGEPYIGHPMRVAATLPFDTDVWIVALLHDVVEDTEVTLDDLAAFGPAVCAAIDAITHRPHEPRSSYYQRVRANPLALRVKLADIADNTHPDRLAVLDEVTRQRLLRKYQDAWHALRGPR